MVQNTAKSFDFSWFYPSQSMNMTWPYFFLSLKMGRLMERKKMGQAIVARTKIAPELRWPTFSAWERRSLLLTDRAIAFGIDFAICITLCMKIKEFIVFPRRERVLQLALFFQSSPLAQLFGLCVTLSCYTGRHFGHMRLAPFHVFTYVPIEVIFPFS